MKNYSLLFLFSMFLFTLSAQEIKKADVPNVVITNMTGFFPQIEVPGAYVKWEKDGKNYKLITKGYKDSFVYAWVDSLGYMLKVEDQVSLNVLPKKAVDNLHAKYPEAEILEAYRYRESTPGSPALKVTFKINAIIKPTLFFNKDGDIIPKP